MAEPKPGRAYVLGLPVDLVYLEEAVAICHRTMASPDGPPRRVITLNPEMAVQAKKDPLLAACFRGEVLVVPDGIGIVLALRRRGYRGVARVPGIELGERLAAEAARQGWPVFLFGGRPGIAEEAAATLCRRFSGLVVAGTAHGYLRPEEEAELVAAIAASGARLLFVGLGVPKQEIWLRKNLTATGARIGIGGGGSFDVWAGKVPRAPLAWRRLGLEWAYRFLREPARWRRFFALPVFFWQALILAPKDREEERREG
ncbi:MAG: WecB/TagA/CpsF family glycosyltransferase [Firmicutes bacterium]|nr:WecB/TagA/CpsF family glycosyltransferase [Bacillota bacterium]